MTLRKKEVTGIWKRKHYNGLSGELAVEGAIDFLQDWLYNDDNDDGSSGGGGIMKPMKEIRRWDWRLSKFLISA